MKVVVTGMVGVDKKSYLQRVLEICAARGKTAQLFNVGDQMYAEAQDITAGRILDIPLKRLASLRRSIFKDIIAKAGESEHAIINTHATFRWRHGLFPAVDFDQMRELNADMYICLIDGADALHVRLMDEHHIRHSLKDLLVWREEELLGTEMLCKGIDDQLPFYCVARGQGDGTVETFYQLMFEPRRKKAYLSFPMTHVVDMPDVQKSILEFRDEMKRHFISFDPGDLEETYLPYYAHKAAASGLKFVELTTLGKVVRFDLQEVLQIERDVNSQIYARDFMLIDQADMIISFIPAGPDGKAMISSGVERELQHAHEAAKDVYIIWGAKARPSIFVTQTATKVFNDTNEAIAFFQKKGYVAQ
jgi:adenylate kinase